MSWEQVLVDAFGAQWHERAATPIWKTDHAQFIVTAYDKMKIKPLECQYNKSQRKKVMVGRPSKRPRLVFKEPFQWELTEPDQVRVEFVGDSLLVVNWARGVWQAKLYFYSKRIMTIQSFLESMLVHHNLRLRMDSAEIFVMCTGN